MATGEEELAPKAADERATYFDEHYIKVRMCGEVTDIGAENGIFMPRSYPRLGRCVHLCTDVLIIH